jgi:hypothetical protein
MFDAGKAMFAAKTSGVEAMWDTGTKSRNGSKGSFGINAGLIA